MTAEERADQVSTRIDKELAAARLLRPCTQWWSLSDPIIADAIREAVLSERAQLTDREREELEKLRVAVQAAYWHLDTYGLVSHPDLDLIESQKRVFDLLRPHCPPIPGRL